MQGSRDRQAASIARGLAAHGNPPGGKRADARVIVWKRKVVGPTECPRMRPTFWIDSRNEPCRRQASVGDGNAGEWSFGAGAILLEPLAGPIADGVHHAGEILT